MKCSICGNEFGDGINCQNCGVDRVTGLGNYRGFEGPNIDFENESSSFSKFGSTKTMVCYKCNEIIPAESLFCPICGIMLWVKCPNCGHEYSSQYSICNKCGTNRNQYLKEEEEKERIKKEKEAEERRIEQERIKEEKIKMEAFKLKERLSNSGVVVLLSIILIFALIMTFCVLASYCTDYIGLWFFILLILSFLILFFIARFGESRDKSNIEKWMKEHPNDPRSKYL